MKLQGLQRSAARLYEELCRPDVQVRVPNVHEGLREEAVKRRLDNANLSDEEI